MFTASGLAVRFLKVFEKSNYNSVKWVRYLTKANGTYQIRVSSLSGSWLQGRILIIGASRSSDANDADGTPNQYKHTSLTVVGVRRLVEVALPRQQ